jgi:hypothetical protein
MDIDFLEHWDQLDELAADIARSSEGKAWHTLALSFVGHRPDILVEAPPFALEDADDITDELISFFGALRPDRLGVLWLNRFEVEGDEVFAVRVNSAEPTGPDEWAWRTRLHPYTVDRARGSVELGDPFDLPHPPDPWSQRLRELYSPRTWRASQRRGVIVVPPAPGWNVFTHPDSTTLDDLEQHAMERAFGSAERQRSTARRCDSRRPGRRHALGRRGGPR